MNKTINKEYLFVLALLFLTSIGILFQFYYGFSWTSTSGHTFASDDAFITYRYAENLFLGNGAYFNVDEKVEGYSNFLYLLLLLPAFLFTTENIYIYSTLTNTFLLFMVMFLFFKILTQCLSKTDAFLGISLIGLNPAVWANVTTGLETMLVLFIFVFLWHSVESPRNRRNIILLIFISTLSMLARVDGFIFPIIVSLYLVLNKEKKLGLSLLLYTISFMSLYALIRYYYYDDIIANTYYAKVSGDLLQRIYAGIKYLYEQTFFNGIAFYALFILFYFIKNRQTLIKKVLSFPSIFLFIWTAYLIYIGGDIYYERFLLVLLVLSIYYFMMFYSDKKLSVKILLLLFASVLSFNIFFQDNRFAYQEKNYDMWINLGKFLKVAPKDYVLAIDAAGKVPYYSELKTIDMLGLNNKEIGKMKVNDRDFHAGHTKFNAEYTLSLKPHLIAAWMDVNQDQGWGITKEKYKQEYVLKYLVNSSRENLSNNIYDVESLEDTCKSKLIQKEFNYAVLVRKDSLLHMPRLSQKVPDFCN